MRNILHQISLTRTRVGIATREHSLAIKVVHAVKSHQAWFHLAVCLIEHNEDSVAPHRNSAICPCANQPWLLGNPSDL
jgi:hypothetical protein